MQVELDALDPDTLQAMFTAAIEEHWDTSTYERVLEREESQRERLRGILDAIEGAEG